VGGWRGGSTGIPAAAPTVDVTGTWRGSVTQAGFGTSTQTLNAVGTGASVSGTYSSVNGTGSVNETVSANTLTFTISPTGCTGTITGIGAVVTNQAGITNVGATFSGAYVCNGTTYDGTGTGNLVKQ